MNLKTTVVLLVLVVAGAGFALFASTIAPRVGLAPPIPKEAGKESLRILESELKAENIKGIKVEQGEQVMVLQRGDDGEWSLPGQWPTRKAAVEQLVQRLTGLRDPRFKPEALGEPPDLKKYGLDDPAVVVYVTAGDKEYKLAFARQSSRTGEKDARKAVTPFAQPTYMRIDDNPDVVQLAPDVLADLQRPPDYYQKRQLFPSERTTREGMGDSQEKIDRLTAKAVAVKEKKDGGIQYSLEKSGDTWVLREPIRDRLDPDKLQSILTAIPDLWAEKFVDKPKKDLAEYGLKEPEETIAVTRPSGETVTLLIGKSSQMKTRTITKPGPPNQFGMPSEPMREVIHEEYRYAKLQDNDQVFEIRGNRLKDLLVAATTLRDNRLARFKTDEARQVEIDQGGKKIVLVKENDKAPWRLKEPMTADAETNKVTDLLDKLSGLQATGMDVIDKGEAKNYGFNMPVGTIKVKAEEEIKEKDETKTKKTKEFTFVIGKHDKAAGKLYVKVDNFDRINAIEDKGKDGLFELVQRPALAYRGRKVFDAPGAELSKIEIQRGDDRLTLEEVKNTWRLTAPVQAEVDTSKVLTLSSDLDRLEAVEYVNDDPQPKDLQEYGLDKPALSATVTFTKDSKPTTRTLQVGKQRNDKQDFFAKLESGKSVFVITKEIHDALDQNSLAFRPQQLWQIKPEDVASIQVQRPTDQFRLQRKDQAWQIAQPFQANASTAQIEELLKTLSSTRAERYEAHVASDLGKYGLDKPALRVAIDLVDKKEDAAVPKDGTKNRVLLVGKPTEADAKTRFAKLGDGEAIFVISEPLIQAVDHSALDFLDRKLLALDSKAINSIHKGGKDEPWTLVRDKEEWRVESAMAKYAADNVAIGGMLRIWNDLQAQKYVGYQLKADELAKYGLDKPEQTLTITMQPAEGEKEPVKHTLTLGKPVEGSAGERYVMVDKGPAVAVLGAAPVTELTRSSLHFADRSLLKLDDSRVTALVRKTGDMDLELAKKDSAWRIVKPSEQAADEETLDNLVQFLARLRASRIAAFQPKELAEFGLDKPEAVWTIRLSGEEKPNERVLRIGKAVPETDKERAVEPDRFVQVEGSPVVGVLSGPMARRLLADPVKFRDRSLARFADADQVTLKRGSREVVFAKVGGTWKLTKPMEADAEHDELNELINSLANLKADEWVAEKPSMDDLKTYGLDRPEAHWIFKADNKDVLNLLVGVREKGKAGEGQRVHAKLNGSDQVFLLDPNRSNRVLAEYRKRSVWASLDAVQVEALSFGYASNPFVLTKMGETWQVAGKPEAKVKAEAVSETLDALSRMKIERYVVDKGADLKLHGFDPPHLVLEIRTRTGSKLVLQVGRNEGDSKRYYARVPDGDRSDVFILSEADANRIVRPLMAFLEGEAKPAKPDKP